MKHLISLAAVVCAFAIHAAPQSFPLYNGENTVSAPGQIVGVECMTVGASQTVTAKVVTAVTEYTNCYTTVSVPHMKYSFTVTNYDGNAGIATNVYDNFRWEPFATNVSWIASIVTNVPSAGITNVVTNIVHRDSRVYERIVTRTPTNIDEQVFSGRLPKSTYTHETDIGNGTASSHYLLLTPANTLNFYGGRIDLSCGTNDNVRILIK